MVRKHDPDYVDGFHKEAIKKIIESPNTPAWLKKIWTKKLKDAGISVKKIKDVV